MGVGTSDSRRLAATEDRPALGLPGDLRHNQAWARLKRGVRNNLAPGEPQSACLLAPEACRVPGQPSPAVGLAWAILGQEPLPRVTLTAGREGVQTGRLCGPPKAGARSWDKTGSDPQPPLSGRGLGHPLLSPDDRHRFISAIHQGHLDQPVLPETGSGHGGPSLEVCSGEPPHLPGSLLPA